MHDGIGNDVYVVEQAVVDHGYTFCREAGGNEDSGVDYIGP